MIAKIKGKINSFVANDKEYPVFTGIAIGFYMIVFYYSKNLELFSWQQFFFFVAYYIAMPAGVLFAIAQILKRAKLQRYARQVIFIVALSFFSFFILQNIPLQHSWVKIFGLAAVVIIVLSRWIKNYKAVVVLILLMAVFPVFGLGNAIFENASNSSEWIRQPDGILKSKFVKTPNVYFIQVDGYANAENLRGQLYRYDNSEFDQWLRSSGFTLYDRFRSNYPSTLKSNASCFNLKHHYSKENTITRTANDYILGENPVLEIFKNNGYKTFFITERPYLMMNRPKLAYGYSNFSYSEVPVFKDGWNVFKPIAKTLKAQIANNKKSKNFFFVQKLSPSHVSTSKSANLGVAGERAAYLQRLNETNKWIKDVVYFINENDPAALVILGADHGGFVGFSYTGQAYEKISDVRFLRSMFGAKMAVKWNSDAAEPYGKHLKTSVNLFRIVFSFLSDNPKFLEKLQPDESYNFNNPDDESSVYKALE